MKTSAIIFIALAFLGISCTQEKKQETPESTSTNTATTVIEKPLLAQNKDLEIAPSSTTHFVTASSGLSLRKGTNLRSQKLLTLPYGAQVNYLYTPQNTEITIDGIPGAMIAVEYQGAKGFVFNGYTTTIAPPHEDETASAYAKRISTVANPVQASEQPHAKGAQYGKTTQINLPTKDWKSTLAIVQRLFNTPRYTLDLNTVTKAIQINPNKRAKTLKDEYEIKRDDKGAITRIVYSYKIKDYGRSILMVKDKKGFVIKEVEGVL